MDGDFPTTCERYGLPRPEPEHQFDHIDGRRWRFDWCWQSHRVALEVDGGVFSGGRHTRGAGFSKDMEKLNEAARQGWTVVRTTPAKLCKIETIDLLADLLE